MQKPEGGVAHTLEQLRAGRWPRRMLHWDTLQGPGALVRAQVLSQEQRAERQWGPQEAKWQVQVHIFINITLDSMELGLEGSLCLKWGEQWPLQRLVAKRKWDDGKYFVNGKSYESIIANLCVLVYQNRSHSPGLQKSHSSYVLSLGWNAVLEPPPILTHSSNKGSTLTSEKTEIYPSGLWWDWT